MKESNISDCDEMSPQAGVIWKRQKNLIQNRRGFLLQTISLVFRTGKNTLSLFREAAGDRNKQQQNITYTN